MVNVRDLHFFLQQIRGIAIDPSSPSTADTVWVVERRVAGVHGNRRGWVTAVIDPIRVSFTATVGVGVLQSPDIMSMVRHALLRLG